MTIEFLKQLAHCLAAQYGTDCEIVIHDLTKHDPNHSIVHIENGHVTNRKIGDGPSQVVLEAMKKSPDDLTDRLGYTMNTSDGKTLKSSTIFIRDPEAGTIQYIFSINQDITRLLYAGKTISDLLNLPDKVPGPAPVSSHPHIQTSVTDLLDDLMEQSVRLVGKPVAMMNREDKITAIQFLNDSGALLIKNAGNIISDYFGISKFTLYDYLKTEMD